MLTMEEHVEHLAGEREEDLDGRLPVARFEIWACLIKFLAHSLKSRSAASESATLSVKVTKHYLIHPLQTFAFSDF